MKKFIIFVIVIVILIAFIYVFNVPAPVITPVPESTKVTTSALHLASTAFVENGTIPSQYTCDVPNPTPPELQFSNIPAGTQSLALVLSDPDVPKQVLPSGVFDHWVVFNIPVTANDISSEGTTALNGAGQNAYAAPCPPPQYEPSEHRYVFTLYALDTMLPLSASSTKEQVLAAMNGHVIEKDILTGRYKRVATSTVQ